MFCNFFQKKPFKETCGGVIVAKPASSPTQSLQTPNLYSNTKNNGLICSWQIQVNFLFYEEIINFILSNY